MRFLKSLGIFCLLICLVSLSAAAIPVIQDDISVDDLPEEDLSEQELPKRIDIITEPQAVSKDVVRFIADNQEVSSDTFEWVEEDISGKALKLDGLTQHLRLAGAQVQKLSSFTFSAWVKRADETADPERFLLSFFRNANYRLQLSPHAVDETKQLNGIHLTMEDPQLDPLSLHHTVGSNVSSALPANEWHHIAVTLSPRAVKVYVDGNFYLGHDFEEFVIEGIDRYRFVIGTEFDGEAQFAGLLDNVFVYTGALDGDQIRLLAQNIEPVKGVTVTTPKEVLATKPYTEPITTTTQVQETRVLGVPPMLIAVFGICIVFVVILSLLLSVFRKRRNEPPEEDHP